MSETVQLLFQNPYAALSPRINVLDTIAEPLLRRPEHLHEQARKCALKMLAAVGLGAEFADRLPHELSGGQRQRVSIARALIVAPKLIIADEPVSALDVTIQAQILTLLNRLRDKHGFSCLFISHDLGVVESIADRVVVLYRGEVVETGDTGKLFSAPQHAYTRALLTASSELRKVGEDRYELYARSFAET
jgi:peptide/nickel transport system ATP-binding protein